MGLLVDFRCLTLLVIGLAVVTAVPLGDLYPYGVDRGDSSLRRADDTSSSEIQLQTPIQFYSGLYTSVFVNSNGHLSFESELPSYQATLVLPLDLGIKLIAAYMSDIDTYVAGNVYYRESTEEALLLKASKDVQSHFSGFPLFEPLSIFIATWDAVAAYKGNPLQVNTFQIVIASDELNSFAIFNYLDDGLQWTKSAAGKLSPTFDDPPAQAGFDSGSGRRHLKLPYSGTTQVQLLAQESNVNVPGKWMFYIGEIYDSANIEGPDTDTGDVEIFIPEVENPTCLEGSRTCHANARCVDYDQGFCCKCIPPSYGNGLQCIAPGTQQRLNGKVSGTINGIQFEDLDMHGFVITKDGRAYTAISKVPDTVASYILTLNTIGGVVGWMFAIPEGENAKNGYTYTGGKFTRVAQITYSAGGSVNISQTFFGIDALNNIRMQTRINGTIPDVGSSLKSITVDDYQEEYKKVASGVIKTFSERTYRVDQEAYTYTWDQTIRFDECTADDNDAQDDTMRMSVSKNFISYDTNVIRFVMTNKISVHTGFDPCVEGATQCHENADCTPRGEDFVCSCTTGFVGNGFYCEDLNECEIGLNTCHENARCINMPGSFQCQCNPGFRGDGRICTPDVERCGSVVCSDRARCVFDDVQQTPVCECVSGYMGNGTYCSPIVFDCNEAEDVCDENAECLYSSQENRYVCECVEGFSGDGQYCESYKRKPGCDCAPNAECVLQPELYFRCICKAGYTGDGTSYCTEIRDYGEFDCDRCHPDASCIEGYLEGQLRRQCRCNAGFVGNGYTCSPVSCQEVDICDVNARCSESVDGQFYCRCNAGFRGNGYRCEEAGCDVLNNCAQDARCMADPRDTSRFICRCNPGFSGDGYQCTRRVIPCNEINNCGNNGECVYDPESLSYRCRCERGYEGDGFTCAARGSDCRRNPRECDPNASCILNVDRFECACNPNYRGDGTTCVAMADGDNYLLFSRGYSLHKVPYNLNGEDKDGTRVLYVPDELAIGVAADCATQNFYWTDVSNGRVSRAGLEGLDQEVVAQGFQSPEGIAIDFLSRNMYITDSALNIIAVANLDGTYRKTLISQDLENPRAIVLDTQRGVMYWTDWYRSNPTIEKANMDGSDRQVFVDTDLGLPNGLTMDPYTQQICWGDAGVNRIECMRSDGVGRRIITEDAAYPFDITMYGNTIYWSDWTIKGVPSVDMNGGEVKDPLPLPVGGNGRLYGITSVGEFCPRVTNACYRSNGGCRYLCLPTPNGGRTCACPDDIDELTCSEINMVKKRK